MAAGLWRLPPATMLKHVRILSRLRRSEIGGLASDTAYVSAWQISTSIADILQLALITQVLGITPYGRFAIVYGFVQLVGQFFDMRVTTASTAFAARLMGKDPRGAAGVFQFSYLVDLATGALGFVVLLVLIPVLGTRLGGHHGPVVLLLLAAAMLAAAPDDTSITILRLADRYRLMATCLTAFEAVRVLLVLLAVTGLGDIDYVAAALLVYAAARALANGALAKRVFDAHAPGARLWSPSLGAVRSQLRPMIGMVFHTNVVSYSRIAMTQLPTVLVGLFAGPTQTGIYRVGMAAGAVVGRLQDPPMVAVLPRISRLWAAGRYRDIRRLFWHGTLIAAPAMAVMLVLVTVFRGRVLQLIGGSDATAAGTVLILSAAGYAVNGALFWNARLHYAASSGRALSILSVAGMALQVTLLFALVPAFGGTGAAVAFLVSQIAINAGYTWLTLRLLGRAEASANDPLVEVAPEAA